MTTYTALIPITAPQVLCIGFFSFPRIKKGKCITRQFEDLNIAKVKHGANEKGGSRPLGMTSTNKNNYHNKKGPT